MASAVRVTQEGFAALVEGDAGAELGAAVDSVRAPRQVIELERAGARATCWVGDGIHLLLVPEQPGWFGAFVLDDRELPLALLRAVGAQEPAEIADAAIATDAGELAHALARAARGDEGRDELGRALEGLRSHWRASDGETAVEVVETGSRAFAVEPDGDTVRLRPVDAAGIYDAMTRELLHA